MRQRKSSFLLLEVLLATTLIAITATSAAQPVRAYTKSIAKLRELEMERLAHDAFIEVASSFYNAHSFATLKKTTKPTPLTQRMIFWDNFAPQRCNASYTIDRITTSTPNPDKNGETIKKIRIKIHLDSNGHKTEHTYSVLAYGKKAIHTPS